MIKIDIIEIPCASAMNVMAKIEEENIKAERERKTAESFPILVNYLVEKIKTYTKKGLTSFRLNLADCYFDSHNLDERIEYYFEGSFNHEIAEKIEEIFSACGYFVFSCSFSNSTYRAGEIKISWR
jgi:hypothetical protein